MNESEEKRNDAVDRLGGTSRLSKLEAKVAEMESVARRNSGLLLHAERILTALSIGPGARVLSHPHEDEPPATWVNGAGEPPPGDRHDHKYDLTLRAVDQYWAVAEGWTYEGGPQLYFISLAEPRRDGDFQDIRYVLERWYLAPRNRPVELVDYEHEL